MITEEKLVSYLEGLKQQLSQLQANVNAVAGAIQFAEVLINELKQEAAAKIVEE